MTLDDFMDKLRESPRDWKVFDHGMGLKPIRRNGYSPLEWVCQTIGVEPSTLLGKAKQIGLSEELTRKIIAAEDEADADPALRKALLDACGLTEDEDEDS